MGKIFTTLPVYSPRASTITLSRECSSMGNIAFMAYNHLTKRLLIIAPGFESLTTNLQSLIYFKQYLLQADVTLWLILLQKQSTRCWSKREGRALKPPIGTAALRWQSHAILALQEAAKAFCCLTWLTNVFVGREQDVRYSKLVHVLFVIQKEK